MMFINKLNLFRTKPQNQAKTAKPQNQTKTEISVKLFLNFYLDTVGWYAIGHHDPEEFLAAIHSQSTGTKFSVEQVVLTWANFQERDFEVQEKPLADSVPITLVEDWGEGDCEFC